MRALLACCLVVAGCSGGDGGVPLDGAPSIDAAVRDGAGDAAPGDAATALDATSDGGPIDGGPESLAQMRDRLIATMGGAPCETWASMDESRRAVFLTITHRLFTSHTPDGLPMLAHVERVYLVLGGGSDGTSCGGAENNRLFVSTDAYLHDRMVETWNDTHSITDDGGSTWIHTRDVAGPHDPFDASIETDTGLRCTLIFEDGDSEPPTAQAHFFVADPVPVMRGSGIDLPGDPHMLEIDQDFDCVHDSNPTCHDFEDRYRTHHGDFECEWVPGACAPVGTGCYRSASSG